MEASQKYLSEVSRVLKPGGYLVYISYGQPQYREALLKRSEFGFSVETHKVFKPTVSTSINISSDDRDLPNVHFVYICKKVGLRSDARWAVRRWRAAKKGARMRWRRGSKLGGSKL